MRVCERAPHAAASIIWLLFFPNFFSRLSSRQVSCSREKIIIIIIFLDNYKFIIVMIR